MANQNTNGNQPLWNQDPSEDELFNQPLEMPEDEAMYKAAKREQMQPHVDFTVKRGSRRGAHAAPSTASRGFKPSGVEIALIVFAVLLGIMAMVLFLPGQLAQVGKPSEQPAASGAASSSSSVEEASSSASQETEPSSSSSSESSSESSSSSTVARANAEELRAALVITEDYRASFNHGPKPAEYQKYIMLHDTESETPASGIVDYWDGNGQGVAAHFVVNLDGSIVQCVPLDEITHHAGFGDAGHNALYGVEDESRDDRVGTVPIGDWAPDYGMNSYSIGIEMVHVGGSGYYPEEQLAAVDALIAYIDAYYGMESQIVDHKAWRTGNSDTSPEFAPYLANYQDHRTHNERPN